MSHSLFLGKLSLGLWLGLLLVGYGMAEAQPLTGELIISGNSLAGAGEYELAVRAYKQAFRGYNSADAAYNLALIYHHELGFLAKAVHYYERFLALEPEAAEVAQVKEWVVLVRQQLNPARQTSTQDEPSQALTKLMEPGGDEFCRQGNGYLAKGEYETAIGAYRQAIIVNQSAAASYNLALLYDYELNYKAKAIYYYQRVMGMSPALARDPNVVTRLEQLKLSLLQEQGSLRVKAYKLRVP